MVVEVMGRHPAGFAVASGIAGGAERILIPERSRRSTGVCERSRRHGAAKTLDSS